MWVLDDGYLPVSVGSIGVGLIEALLKSNEDSERKGPRSFRVFGALFIWGGSPEPD